MTNILTQNINSNKFQSKKINDTLNILRIFSFFCVIAVHFFLNSGFYNEIVNGKKMLILCIFRSLFIICVPMFITLTGYLMNKKELSINYYLKLNKTLVMYLLCSIVYLIFAKFYLHQEINISIFLKNLLSYSGTPYSWYIEMYIGLYLLIPFLNIIFNNLKSKKDIKILLITLIILCGLPTVLNIYNFSSTQWWKTPSLSNTYLKIIPDWWNQIYPIFYYFLGAYLSKYKIKISAFKNFILLIIFVIFDGLFNFYRSHNSIYLWGSWSSYSSLTVMFTTFLTFNFILKIQFNKDNFIRSTILKYISNACLGAYLISCIFDNLYYEILNTKFINFTEKIKYAPLIILASFTSSIILSLILNFIYSILSKLLNTIKARLRVSM